eukprot:g60272.t1
MSGRRKKPPRPAPKSPSKKPEGKAGSAPTANKPGKKDQEETLPQYVLVGGKSEAMALWLDILNREEKRQVLEIKATEVVDELQRLGLPEITNLTKVEQLLSDSEFMSALRFEFIKGLNNEGVMQAYPSNLVELSLYRVMESHLLFLYTETTVLSKLFMFMAFMVWQSERWWLVRYPLVLLLFWLWWTEWPSFLAEHRSKMLAPFRDPAYDRMEDRTDAFLCGVLVAYWGGWLSWYVIALIVACLPLVMVEVEKFTSIRGGDQNAIRYITMGLLTLSCIQLLYLAWFSWHAFVFVAFLFFPRLSVLFCTVVLSAMGFCTTLVDRLFSLLLDYQKHGIIFSILFGLSFISFLFLTSGWYRVLSGFLAVFFWPKILPLTNLLFGAAAQFGMRGLRGTVVLLVCLLLVGVVILYEIFLRVCCGKKPVEDQEGEYGSSDQYDSAEQAEFEEETGLD